MPRQLAGLADRDEADACGDRGRSGEDEAARLDARHDVELSGERRDDRVGGRLQGLGVGEQRGDVAEDDPRLGIVGDAADQGFGADEGGGEIGVGHRSRLRERLGLDTVGALP